VNKEKFLQSLQEIKHINLENSEIISNLEKIKTTLEKIENEYFLGQNNISDPTKNLLWKFYRHAEYTNKELRILLLTLELEMEEYD
jgi:hypothetical protein